jgi:hypothetical protein
MKHADEGPTSGSRNTPRKKRRKRKKKEKMDPTSVIANL